MCHIVRHHKNKFYYAYHYGGQTFYGLKLMRIAYDDENNPLLVSYYLNEVYNYEMNDGMIEVFSEPTYQPVGLGISVLTDGKFEDLLEIETGAFAGMHISPLITEDEEHFREYVVEDWENSFIVWFSANDIAFYDGMDVSVTRFIIPRADILERDYVLHQIFSPLDLDALIRNHKYLYLKLGINQEEKELH